MNNFTIKIVKPDTPVVPNTGLFSQGINGISTIFIPIIILISIISVAFLIKKAKKTKTQVFLHNFKRHFKNLLSKKSTITTLSILAIVAASATFISLRNNSNLNQVNAEGNNGILSVTTEDINITTELEDESVYAESISTITVNTSTTTGYTISAYAEKSDLYLNGDESETHKISGLGTVYSTRLKANTWGMSISTPEDQTSPTFRGLPASEDDALVVRVADGATEAGETTNLHYGVYLTPDLVADGEGYGEYKGVTVNYIATTNVDVSENDITVNYYGSGLNFPDGISDPNVVIYGDKVSEYKMAYKGDYCSNANKSIEPIATYNESTLASEDFTIIQKEGADKIQMVIEYDLAYDEEIVAVQGLIDPDAMAPETPYILIMSETSGSKTATFIGDTVTLYSSFTANSSFTINFYPIYDEAITGTEEVSICNIVRSDNVNDEGEQQAPYSGKWVMNFQAITIPGAEKMMIELKYGFTGAVQFGVVEGVFSPDGDEPQANYEMIELSDGQTISNDKHIIDFNGDTVSFLFVASEIPEENYDYGFFAKVFPYYNEEHENTTTMKVSGSTVFDVKKGEYKEPEPWQGKWLLKDNDNNVIEEFNNKEEIEEFLETNKVTLAGATVNLYAFSDIPYAISYNGNGASSGSMDGFDTVVAVEDGVTEYAVNLIAPNFKKDGYGFAGWSLDPDAEVNDPNYIIYGPNQVITQTEIPISEFNNVNKKITLYAVWVPTSGTIQNWSGCNSMAEGQVIALTDNRDDNVYTVSKFADDRCWMMENLRLDNNVTITADNTNNPAQGFTLTSSSEDWCFDDTEECINRPAFNNNNTNMGGTNASGETLIPAPGFFFSRDFVENQSEDFIGLEGNKYEWYAYGNYYNWYSATAGTGTYDTGRDQVEEANGSICPAGWSLPSLDDFGELIVVNGVTSDVSTFPFNFIGAGLWGVETYYDVDPMAFYRGLYTAYWSRRAYNGSAVVLVYTRVGNDYARLNEATSEKNFGLSVRCFSE